jgi:hypothetical protein
MITSFDNLLKHLDYKELKQVRNILSHRAAPGRNLYMSTGPSIAQPAEWKVGGIKLDATMTSARRMSIAALLQDVLKEAASFVAMKFP